MYAVSSSVHPLDITLPLDVQVHNSFESIYYNIYILFKS